MKHHPKDETLEAFAAGRLDEARAVVVATHIAMCTECAEKVVALEEIGGALLDSIEPVPVADTAFEAVLRRAGQVESVITTPVRDRTASLEKQLPLSAYMKTSIDDVSWKPVAPGVSQSIIPASGYRDGALRLLKIDQGTKMLKHSHKGEELTLILRGAYKDELDTFSAGDLADLDGDHTHTPEAIGDEPCICLIATSAPLAFKSIVGRVMQPFVGL